MSPEPLPVDRAPLTWHATHIPGLIEFQRVDCWHPHPAGECPECATFASRGQLEVALRAAESHDVRLGDVWVNESDVRLLLSALDDHDRERRAS